MNLVLIRQRIELEVARLSKSIEKNKTRGSWFSGWWGKPASEDDQDVGTSTDICKFVCCIEMNLYLLKSFQYDNSRQQ